MALRFQPHGTNCQTGKKFEVVLTDDSAQIGDEYEVGVAPAGGITFDSTVTSPNKEGKIMFVSGMGFTQPGEYKISVRAVLDPTNCVGTTVHAEKPSVVISLPASEDEIPPIPDNAPAASTEVAPTNTEASESAPQPEVPAAETPTPAVNENSEEVPAPDKPSKRKNDWGVIIAIAAVIALVIAVVFFANHKKGNDAPTVVAKTDSTPVQKTEVAKTDEKNESDKPSQADPTTAPSNPPAPAPAPATDPAPAPAPPNSSDVPRMPTPPESWPTTPQTVQRVRL